jgi:outer membrane cobalamin receptor
MRPALLILLLVAGQAGAAALVGRVVDAESGAPLAGANLRLLESRSGCATDLAGRFRLDLDERATGRVLVSHLGYRDRELAATARPESLLVRLEPSWLRAGDLVYSADAREQTTRNATSRVEILTREELERAPSQELSRVLETVPGVSVKRSDGTTTNSLSIRGSSNLLGGGVGNRVLLLVDGKPAITADTGGADWSMVPLAVVDRVEVAKGSYSSLYGSTAMGGVINLVTMREFPRHRTTVQAGYGLGELPAGDARFRDTPATENHLSITHTNQLDRLGYYLSYAKRESNGHRQNSDYLHHALSTRFRLGERQAPRHWELTLGYATLNRGFPHSWDSRRRPLHISRHHPEWLDDRQEKATVSADLSFEQAGPRSILKARSWATAGVSRTAYHDAGITDTRSDADKLGLRLSWDWLGWRRQEWILGADLITDRVDGRPADVFYGRHQTSTRAVFIQDQVRLPWSAPGWLAEPLFTLGTRADHHLIHGGRDELQLSPKAGVSLSGDGPLADWTLRASAGTAFRNPSIADLFLKSVPGNDYSFIANPELKAEESRSWEAGLLWRGRRVSLDFTHFRYQYRDMIHYRDSGQPSVFEIVNLNRSRIQGMEISADYRSRRLAGNLGYTLVDALNQDTGEPLPYQPRHTVAGSAAWMPGKWRLSATARHVSETEKVRFYASDAPGAYTLLGLKAAYTLGDVEVAGAVENLGDVAYEEMERYRMPGRTWRMDLLFHLGG